MHFSPTEVSAQNLLNEGKDKSKIYITGNTAIDAMATTVDEIISTRFLSGGR